MKSIILRIDTTGLDPQTDTITQLMYTFREKSVELCTTEDFSEKRVRSLLGDIDVVICYNAKFMHSFLGKHLSKDVRYLDILEVIQLTKNVKVTIKDLVDGYGLQGDQEEQAKMLALSNAWKELVKGKNVASVLKEIEDSRQLSFGKYAGTQLKEVPTDYLQWCYSNFDKDSLGSLHIARELERRHVQ